MLVRRNGVPNARQDLDGAEEHAPHRDGHRQQVGATGAMPPRPNRCPDAARRHHAHCTKVAYESKPTPRRIRPEHHRDADGERQRQPREDAERRRAAWLGLGRTRSRGAAAARHRLPRRLRPFLGSGRHQCFVGKRCQLLVDLRELLFPIAVSHQLTLSLLSP